MSDFSLRDEDTVAELRLRVRRSGAMSVEGCITDEAYALSMLDAARDSIKSHNKRIQEKGIIIPNVVN